MNFSTRDDSPNGPVRQPDFSTVTLFEQKIAEFFGASYGVATDSCTSALELCLRYTNAKELWSERHTYVSVPMLAAKLGIDLTWKESNWQDCYHVGYRIFDAAVMWREGSYKDGCFMCISFQYQKHLSLGRGGMILCDNAEAATQLKKMSYDGRLPGIPWREQDIDTMGYHYYMTPETAQLGLDKLQAAIDTPPRIWSSADYPDISKFKVFNNG